MYETQLPPLLSETRTHQEATVLCVRSVWGRERLLNLF